MPVTGERTGWFIVTFSIPDAVSYAAEDMAGGADAPGGSVTLYVSVAVEFSAVLSQISVMACMVTVRGYNIVSSICRSVLFSFSSMESLDGCEGAPAVLSVAEESFIIMLPDIVGRMRSSSFTASVSFAG